MGKKMQVNSRPSLLRGPFVSFQSILKNRNLLSLMVRRDLKTTYGGYFLGYAWTLLEPIFFTLVFFVIFVILRGNPDELLPLNIMLGILIYSAFSKTVSKGSTQLIRNAGLIHQVSFPRELLIANVSGFQLVRLILSLVIVPIYMIYMGIAFTMSFFLLPLAVFGIILLAHGISQILCIAVVFVRDTSMVVDIGLRALFFLSGVFYSAAHIPGRYLDYHLMNPIAAYIEICRGAVLGDLSYVTPFVILRTIGVTFAILLIGSSVFNRYQNRAVIHL